MLKVAIVDDEIQGLRNLRILLQDHCIPVNFVFTTTDPLEASRRLQQKNQIDVLFLDIRMPSLDGFELLEQIGDYDFEVIFVTAFDDYALKALKISALDYLLKPIDIPELQNAVAKIGSKNRAHQRQQFQLLQNYLHEKLVDQQIALPQSNSIEVVQINDIIYCRSESNYTWFFLKSDRKILVCRTLKEYERLLSHYGFLRVHQSYLINTRHVTSIEAKRSTIKLVEQTIVPIAQARKSEVLRMLRNL